MSFFSMILAWFLSLLNAFGFNLYNPQQPGTDLSKCVLLTFSDVQYATNPDISVVGPSTLVIMSGTVRVGNPLVLYFTDADGNGYSVNCTKEQNNLPSALEHAYVYKPAPKNSAKLYFKDFDANDVQGSFEKSLVEIDLSLTNDLYEQYQS